MTRYAEKTEVPVSRSQVEIRNYLLNKGAKQILQFEDQERNFAGIGFLIQIHRIKITLPLPDLKDFRRTPKSFKLRSETEQRKVYDQDVRQRWRALLLIIKAKFEAIELGITTIEREFLADLLLPDGQTIEQSIIPQLQQAYERGGMPKLLPWVEKEG